MKNKCENCGKCCLDTEMPLSTDDIARIIKDSKNELKREDFTIKSEDGYYQLKNIDSHCFFLDMRSKTCKIYESRPQGCIFYPLIFDYNNDICVFDEICPKTDLFYQNKVERRKFCKQIKDFLKKSLKII